MQTSDNNGIINTKHRRSTAIKSLLKEAEEFMRNNVVEETASNNSDTDNQQVDGRRRSRRRLTQACKNSSITTPMRSAYHVPTGSEDVSNSSPFSLSDNSLIQASSPRDMFGVDESMLHAEMESLEIQPRSRRTIAARRKGRSTLNKTLPSLNDAEQPTESMDVTFPDTASPQDNAECAPESVMEIQELEENVDSDLLALYCNKNFVKPENAGLETIEEVADECVEEVESSPVKSKRARGAPRKKVTKNKQPWRFIPHLVVNPPEIWWQELPLTRQKEIRKKAHDAGYRPASKKRLETADKRMRTVLEQLDRHFKAEEHADMIAILQEYEKSSASSTLSPAGSSLDGECSQINETTFNSLQVFVGDSSNTSASFTSTLMNS